MNSETGAVNERERNIGNEGHHILMELSSIEERVKDFKRRVCFMKECPLDILPPNAKGVILYDDMSREDIEKLLVIKKSIKELAEFLDTVTFELDEDHAVVVFNKTTE